MLTPDLIPPGHAEGPGPLPRSYMGSQAAQAGYEPSDSCALLQQNLVGQIRPSPPFGPG